MSFEYQSESEQHGLDYMRPTDLKILSVGISTGGQAEVKMASKNPERRIVATTLDTKGVELTRELIKSAGYSDQIETKVEDVSETLPYGEAYFDYIYARLVLHYLSKEKLVTALQGLFRVTRPGGNLFVVVRSDQSDEAQQASNVYDTSTGLTTYSTPSGHQATRYFHSIESISTAIQSSGYSIMRAEQYDEMLNASFDRTGMWVKNNVIEVLASKEQ